jgi:hypothetical protein
MFIIFIEPAPFAVLDKSTYLVVKKANQNIKIELEKLQYGFLIQKGPGIGQICGYLRGRSPKGYES